MLGLRLGLGFGWMRRQREMPALRRNRRVSKKVHPCGASGRAITLLDRRVIEALQRDRSKTLMLDALARLQVPGAHFQNLIYRIGLR